MQVVDRLQFHVEQIADGAMIVGGVADSVKLQVGVTHAGFDRLLAELKTLREFDSVGCGLHAVVSDFARVTNRVQEVRRQRRLATRELHRHLTLRLHRDRIVQHSLDLFPGQFVDISNLVSVHKAGIAHHVAAIGEIDSQHGAASILHRGRTMVMQLLVVVRADIAAGENVFEVLREFRVNRHQVFEVPVLGTVLDHPDLAVALDDLGLDLAHFFVHQHVDRQVAVENLLPNFRHALGTKRIGRPRPAERRLRLFPGLEQRLVGPLGNRRRIRSNAIQAFKDCPRAGGGNGHGLLNIFDRLMHSALAFLHSGVRTVPTVPRTGTCVKRLVHEETYHVKPRSFDAWSGSH